jgi:hypothetical protein
VPKDKPIMKDWLLEKVVMLLNTKLEGKLLIYKLVFNFRGLK